MHKKNIAKKNNTQYTKNMELGLTNDFIFKYVFGQQDDAPHLLALVNAVLEDSGFSPVVSLKIQDSNQQKDADWLRGSVLDIKAKDEKGIEYNIEMQIANEPNFRNRSLYYWAKAYSYQLKKNDMFAKLKPVICINIIDFELFRNINQFHTCFMLIDKKISDTVLSEDLQIHFIELPKARHFSGKLADLANLIARANPIMEEEMNVLLKKDPIYEEVYERYTHCMEDELARYRAISRDKFERDHASRLYSSFTEGLEKGISQGAHQKALDDARNFKKLGVSLQIIAQATGLALSEIETL